MLGLVFTFEEDPEHDPVLVQHAALKRAREAISLAINFVDGIHFEEITTSEDPMPKMGLIFKDLGLVDAFTARLTLALQPTGLRLKSVREIHSKAPAGQRVAA